MIVRFALIACLSMPFAAPAVAQDNSTAAAPPVKEKKICQEEEETGSLMPKRVCHTKEEWAQIAKDNAASNNQFTSSMRGHSAGFGH